MVPPRVEVFDGPGDVGARVADLVAATVEARPDAVLGLPTGGTPGPVYAELVRRSAAGEIDLRRVRVFLLDEYVGLGRSHPRSYRATIARELTDAVGVPDDAVRGPVTDGDLDTACRAYDDAVRAAGGVDLQLLGIGRNGHIAFNEPGTPFELTTHTAVLSEPTRRDNARFFTDPAEVPTLAVTQGPALILEARRLVLVATGAAKADAVAAALEGPVSPECPASVIRRHPDAVVVLDRAAAGRLRPAPTPR